MEFLVWHAIAITSVIAISFMAGFTTAQMLKKSKK